VGVTVRGGGGDEGGLGGKGELLRSRIFEDRCDPESLAIIIITYHLEDSM